MNNNSLGNGGMVGLLHLLEVVKLTGELEQFAVGLHESVLLHEEAPVGEHVHHATLVIIGTPMIF